MPSANTLPERPLPDRPAAPPRLVDFYAINKGGGLYSEAVSQWMGAALALAADRLRIRPTVLTMVNLALGIAGSAAVVVLAPAAAAGDLAPWALGLFALVVWQIAYVIDCSDGMLARVTGQTSDPGARVDILVDVAVQISVVTALSAAATAYRPDTPAWLVAVFVGTWMVNLVTSVMHSQAGWTGMISRSTLPIRVAKLVRDPGAVLLGCGLVLTVLPRHTVWVLVVLSGINGLFLLVTVLHTARAALRAKPGGGAAH